MFNSETNPKENNFNLDDTEFLRKNAFKRPEDNNSLKDKKGPTRTHRQKYFQFFYLKKQIRIRRR